MARSRLTVDELLAEARERIDRLAPAEVASEMAKGAILVDTRCDEDRIGEGVISGSIHIPRTVLEWRADPGSEYRDERIADLGARLILMCNDGYSSSLAGANLVRMGFRSVADLDGGYRGWVDEGQPIERLE